MLGYGFKAQADQAVGETGHEVMCACTGNCDNDCCPVRVMVRDGKATNIRRNYYDDNRSEIHHQQNNCLRCYDNIERIYGQKRIQTPLRRAGPTKTVMRGDDYRRMRKAKNLFLWGTNPAESMMVSYHNITKTRENGGQSTEAVAAAVDGRLRRNLPFAALFQRLSARRAA